MTNPNVGVMPALNPAYIGINRPNKRYKDMMITASINDADVRAMINTTKSCNDTLILSPNGSEIIPIMHIMASIMAFLVILLIVLAEFIPGLLYSLNYFYVHLFDVLL